MPCHFILSYISKFVFLKHALWITLLYYPTSVFYPSVLETRKTSEATDSQPCSGIRQEKGYYSVITHTEGVQKKNIEIM